MITAESSYKSVLIRDICGKTEYLWVEKLHNFLCVPGKIDNLSFFNVPSPAIGIRGGADRQRGNICSSITNSFMIPDTHAIFNNQQL